MDEQVSKPKKGMTVGAFFNHDELQMLSDLRTSRGAKTNSEVIRAAIYAMAGVKQHGD